MLKKKFILLLFLFLSLVLFRKVFLGELPMPSAEFVVGYFPWNAGGWVGFQEVIPFKAIVATDVFRQQFPWIKLSLEEVRQGQWPLWNPYNFSGIPHLANPQTHFFYPFNFLFFILPFTEAWVVFVSLTPFLSMLFMYLYTGKLNFSPPVRIFTSIAFAFSSIMIFWLEWGFIAQGLMFLPLFLWLIEEIIERTRVWQFFALIFLQFSEITSGYFPLIIYVFILSFSYFIYRLLGVRKSEFFKKKVFGLVFFAFILGILLSSIQLLPTLEAYHLSAREGKASEKIFTHHLLSPRHLITIFAPDFFGNFMTRNFWDRDYTEIVGWFGVVALVLAILGIILSKHKLKKFYLISILAALIFALKNPVAYLPLIFKIPILSSGLPSRSLFIFEFSMVVLAGMFLDEVTKLSNYPMANFKKMVKILILVAGVYLGLWLFVLLGKEFLTGEEWEWRLTVSKRNLILPSSIFLGTSFCLILLAKFKKFTKFFLVLIFLLALVEYFYFANKFLPFGPKKYIFPSHPLIEFLKQNQGFYRHYGVAEARVDTNFASFLKLYSPEGFDSLYPKRYGQFVGAALNGEKPQEVARSDTPFPQKNTKFRRKAFNLLGIKYFIKREDRYYPKEEIGFGEDQDFVLLWQEGVIKVFENKAVLSRTFMVGDYQVADSDEQILAKFFSDDLKPANTLVLEKEVTGFQKKELKNSSSEIVDYQPNQVLIKTNSYDEALLFLSDTFYPGWQAFVDGKETEIYRANYVFRAVRVPSGEHQVRFIYQPLSFILGKNISFCVFLLVGGTAIFLAKKKSFSKKI